MAFDSPVHASLIGSGDIYLDFTMSMDGRGLVKDHGFLANEDCSTTAPISLDERIAMNRRAAMGHRAIEA